LMRSSTDSSRTLTAGPCTAAPDRPSDRRRTRRPGQRLPDRCSS
jgi:hypothetical protein